MEPKPKHPWIARLSVGVVMLVLAFAGVIATDVNTTGGWEYWKWIIPVYAILALWLSWYERRQKETVKPLTLWHELLHWVGLFAAIVLVEIYVETGLLSRFMASLMALTLLSLTVFTIGIYVEWSFLLIGVVLGLFALLIATTIEYLYAFTVPLLVIAIVILWLVHWRMSKRQSGRQHE